MTRLSVENRVQNELSLTPWQSADAVALATDIPLDKVQYSLRNMHLYGRALLVVHEGVNLYAEYGTAHSERSLLRLCDILELVDPPDWREPHMTAENYYAA